MTPTPEPRPGAGQPPLAELLARFLGRQTEAVAAGMAAALAVDAGAAAGFPQALLALAALRLARQWDAAEALVRANAGRVPAAWADAWANEEAALLWHRGQKDEAARRWRELPESVPVLFNRGMAALFTGRPAAARADLRRAVERLPESSGWHHLGRLYLALAGGC